MDFPLDLLFLLGAAVGVVGVILPVLPGTLLILGIVVGWAIAVDESAGWVVLGIVVALLAVGTVVKYAVPGRHLKRSGVPTRSILIGAVLGVVGFFVIPVVGLPIGFVLGVFLAEARRVGASMARSTTITAVTAVGLSVLIELTAALLATTALFVGAVTT